MDDIKQEQKKYGAGPGDNFEFEDEGVYRLRILHQPKIVATHFFGKGNPSVVCIGIDEGCPFHKGEDKKPSIKLVTYVIDRADGKVKMAELPLSLSYALNDLQQDSDFAFEGFPMPYDVKVTYDPDNNDPKAKYRLVASPKQEALTTAEEASFAEKLSRLTPEQYVENKKNRQKEKGTTTPHEYPKESLGEVPF